MSAETPAMRAKFGRESYVSPNVRPGFFARVVPGLYFYARVIAGPARWLHSKAVKGQCDDVSWTLASARVADILEKTGCKFYVNGLQHLANVGEPCVIVANHVSTLETFVLPGIVRPLAPVTFVVKDSLARMPLFGPIMRSRNPVTVTRKNPREDLKTVLEEGSKRLRDGVSIIVFPQATRSPVFDRSHFNSVGVKLAARTGAPVIPLALKTDAWGNGKKIREFGKINPRLPARFTFGEPIRVSGSGKAEHAACCDFIESTFLTWQKKDGVNS